MSTPEYTSAVPPPLPHNSTQCNMHGSRAATENCMKCGISLKQSFGQIIVKWYPLEIPCTWITALSNFKQINLKSVYIYTPKCCTLTVYGSHTLLQIPAYLTQFLTHNDQNSTWKCLHASGYIVYSQICHKYIHIMGGKDQTSKEIPTCQNFVSRRICCEEAAAGKLRAFPVHTWVNPDTWVALPHVSVPVPATHE